MPRAGRVRTGAQGADPGLAMTVRDDQVVAYDVIADPGRLRQVDLAVL